MNHLDSFPFSFLNIRLHISRTSSQHTISLPFKHKPTSLLHLTHTSTSYLKFVHTHTHYHTSQTLHIFAIKHLPVCNITLSHHVLPTHILPDFHSPSGRPQQSSTRHIELLLRSTKIQLLRLTTRGLRR